MRNWLLLAVALIVLTVPAWAIEKTYNGSVDPTTDGWTVWEGVNQGSVFDEGGGNFSWFLNDASDKKTKLRIGNGVNVNPDVGAYIESRVKCTSYSRSGGDGTPLNVGLQIYYVYPGPSTYRAGHWVTIRPDQLAMKGNDCKPGSYSGTFSNYHTVRLVYKRLDLRTRGSRTDAWGVYLDGGSPVPVLHSWSNGTTKDWGGPTFGSGNTGDSQDIYFDWVYYNDVGAYPPGMDGSVQFVNGDPDGVADPSGQSFTITWQTNVPTTGELRYSIDGDNSFSGVAQDPQNPTLSTTHSVTVTGTIPGATYEYIAVSTDASGKKAISLPVRISLPNPFFISAGPACTIAPNGQSATITWSTNEADSSSEVHYGFDSTCPNVAVEPGGGGLTDHSVTILTEPNKVYYYYVKSYSATWPPTQSSVRSFNTYIFDEVLDNAGFEDGTLAPWVKVNPFTGIMNSYQWAVPAHSGSKWAGSVASYGTMNHGYLYQKVATIPGKFYEAKVWIWTRRQSDDPTHPSHPLDVACAIGIDPYGGTAPDSPNISWSGWKETADSCTDGDTGPGGPWTQISTGVKAKGTEATIFLIQQHMWPLVWNINGFDDASFEQAPPPPADIGATRRLSDGYPAELTGKVVTGAFTDVATLEQFFYIEEADRSSGIKVLWNGVVTPGELRNVSGTVKTINGEKTIVADEVGPETPETGEIPAPLGVTGKSIVDSFGFKALTTQGLRVTTWGRVTYRDAGMFYIDDGTGWCDNTTTDWEGNPVRGLRVYMNDSLVSEGDYVYVVGIPGTVGYTDTTQNPPVTTPIPVIWATSAVPIAE